MTTRPRIRPAAVATAFVLAALALTACAGTGAPAAGGNSGVPLDGAPSASASPGAHNAQDAAFARAMIPHHRQAVAMAALAPGRAGSTAVRTLAAHVAQAQRPEITAMAGWLTAWGAAAPAVEGSGDDGMAGMAATPSASSVPQRHGRAAAMPGMMSGEDMTALRGLRGAAFDSAFLRMMISHHQGAVTMARTERSSGMYGPARELAASIVASQSAEIARMRTMPGGR
ncbi:DUF305 domain-containing protein [Streptomyces sp. NBC_01497]|uniref:DUF305 domain-containing protein n=1 Tax=Streptomyces sp. NBC_01497 TaxID=2903885 RepID=UPI002E34F246|nr:DUF305 domain-containing protein [Streptomyces sp. NBC_01497]